MRKKLVSLIAAMTLFLSFSTVVYAAIPIGDCPIVQNASDLDKWLCTPYEIHQTNPMFDDDYQCWVTTDGGMYNLHEMWTCSLCGNLIRKTTFMGSITDILNEENVEIK